MDTDFPLGDGMICGTIRCGDFHQDYACSFWLLKPAVIQHLFKRIGDALASAVEHHLQMKFTDEQHIGHA